MRAYPENVSPSVATQLLDELLFVQHTYLKVEIVLQT